MPLIGLKKKYRLSDIEKLRAFTASRWPKELSSIHGVEHWDRVAEFGKMLYVEGADMDVIMAFAYLHDSERKGDGYDYNHGLDASKFVDAIRHSKLSFLDDGQISKLKRACELHTDVHRTGDITIDICFDADRMDLFRVGIIPLPERMATKQGSELVSRPDFIDFYVDFVDWFRMGMLQDGI